MKNIILIIISIALAALIGQFKGDAWEEKLRQVLYKITDDSIPNYAQTLVDNHGIPYVKYAAANGVEAADEYNPTIVCNYALEYYAAAKTDSSTNEKFNNCIQWLANNITYKDSFALFQFNWKQPFYDSVGTPWTSGMTSGRAIEAFTLAYQLDNKQKHLEHAAALLKGFYQPIQAGGFTYMESTGWWFEEFADSNMHTPRVLDGHIFATTGVYTLWQLTKNDSANFIFIQGVQSLKTNLPAYDKGDGWSYYDRLHLVSDKKYHTILTGQMKQLWQITGDPFFKNYYEKWVKPLNRPYVYRIIKEKNRSGVLLILLLTGALFILLQILKRMLVKSKI